MRKPAGGRVAEEAAELKPVILVPTPAQLEAGIRVIDADPAVWCASVKAMVERAKRNNWTFRVTYSQFIDVSSNRGKHAGEAVTKHTLAVRMWRDSGIHLIRCYGMWHGTDEDGWKASGAGAVSFLFGMVKLSGITDLEKLIDGRMTITRGQTGLAALVPAQTGTGDRQ